MQEEAAIGRPLAGMVSLVARGGALTATRQGGGVGAVHGVRFAAAVLKTSAKYLKPRIYLVVKVCNQPILFFAQDLLKWLLFIL